MPWLASLADWDWATIAQLAVALGTAALATSTWKMATAAGGQARSTQQLAEIAERQLEATTTPIVRVMRVERSDRADIVTVNKGADDEALVVRLENRGPVPAGIEQCTMVPGSDGHLADADLESPVLEPNGEWDVDFHPSDRDKARYAAGAEVLIQVVYEAIGSGARYRVRTYVKRKGEGPTERWLMLREEGPDRL